MDLKKYPNEVESSIFDQVATYAIWCANYDKKVYEKSKQESLEDISITKKRTLKILSLLEKLGYPMNELGTYFYERLILSVYENLIEIIDKEDIQKYEQLVSELNDNYSSFYLWLARDDLEIGIKSFHFYIEKAISKANNHLNDELISDIYDQNIEVSKLNQGNRALHLAMYLLKNSEEKTHMEMNFKIKKLGTFSSIY